MVFFPHESPGIPPPTESPKSSSLIGEGLQWVRKIALFLLRAEPDPILTPEFVVRFVDRYHAALSEYYKKNPQGDVRAQHHAFNAIVRETIELQNVTGLRRSRIMSKLMRKCGIDMP